MYCMQGTINNEHSWRNTVQPKQYKSSGKLETAYQPYSDCTSTTEKYVESSVWPA